MPAEVARALEVAAGEDWAFVVTGQLLKLIIPSNENENAFKETIWPVGHKLDISWVDDNC